MEAVVKGAWTLGSNDEKVFVLRKVQVMTRKIEINRFHTIFHSGSRGKGD